MMPKAYSNDLRLRAARLVAQGKSCRQAAALLEISVSTVVRCAQRLRTTGSADARPRGGQRRVSVLESERAWLERRRTEEPHVTLRGLVAELARRGVQTSYGALQRFFKREGLSFPPRGPARRRAGPPGRTPAARAVAQIPGQG